MWIGLFCIALAVAIFFAVRYLLLRRALKTVERDLAEITRQLDENRIVRLPHPNRELEALLKTINVALAEVRRSAVDFSHREAKLKAQIEHISHDLRTPLTGILGYLSLIDADGLKAEDRQSLEIVKRKALSLQGLITEFYRLSILDAQTQPHERQEVDLGRLTRESAAQHYRLLEQDGLTVSVEVPDSPIPVFVNREATERIIENLLQNAARYARSFLSIAVATHGDKATLTFTNDVETPISDDQLEQLFEPFTMLDEARLQEGSGLGLTVARSLAENMGGSLTAESSHKTGAHTVSFKLELPIT
ncbi:MAG TPA: sensor histidine kinase [Coriobacteriia bacterium]|nr:sensor histidine kinase [Coriobacteriia bacterium]